MRVEVIQGPKIVTRCKRVMPTDLLRAVELPGTWKVMKNAPFCGAVSWAKTDTASPAGGTCIRWRSNIAESV